MKVFLYSVHAFDKKFLEKASGGKHELSFTEQALGPETVHLCNGHEAIALFSSDLASAEVLDTLHILGVKYIALRSVGYDHVNLKHAHDLGIKVANVPAYSPYAIAEHAVALLLALNRKLIQANLLVQKNDFRLDTLVGFDLHGKTVGVVGTGKIGAAFTRIMLGFGCRVIACDPEINPELIQLNGFNYMSIQDLCRQADIISVCCPLNDSTKYLFSKPLFSIMKPGVLFINTARGAVVNTVDLIEAMEIGIVSAAGLDVYENEKPLFFYDHSGKELNDILFEKLRNIPGVLITGHQAFLTEEALAGIAGTTFSNINEWEEKHCSSNDLLPV